MPEVVPPQVPEMKWGEIPWWKNFGDPPLVWETVQVKVQWPWWTTVLLGGLYLFVIWVCFFLWGLRSKLKSLRKEVVSDVIVLQAAERVAKEKDETET